jgi:hypothetical protein
VSHRSVSIFGVTEFWLPLGTAIIGAVAGLLAGAMGPMVSAERAHKHWVRDKRAALCEEYFAALNKTISRAKRPHITGFVAAVDGDNAAAGELSDAAGRLELYASTRVGREANGAAEAFMLYAFRMVMIAGQPDELAEAKKFKQEYLDIALPVKQMLRSELDLDTEEAPRRARSLMRGIWNPLPHRLAGLISGGPRGGSDQSP